MSRVGRSSILGRRRGVHHHRFVPEVVEKPRQRWFEQVGRRSYFAWVEPQRSKPLARLRDLAESRLGAAAGQDQRRAGRRGYWLAGVVIAVVVANDLAKRACQSRGPRDDGHPLHGMGNCGQVVVVEGVENYVADTSGCSVPQFAFDRHVSAPDPLPINEFHRMRSLAGHHPRQVGVGHRGQRVMTHRGLRQQLVGHEQMTLVYGSSVLGSGGAYHRHRFACGIEQCVGDGADIAFGSRIEGGTVLEVDRAHFGSGDQPIASSQ